MSSDLDTTLDDLASLLVGRLWLTPQFGAAFDAKRYARSIIDEAIAAHEAAQWVSVEDRLPETPHQFGSCGHVSDAVDAWDGFDLFVADYRRLAGNRLSGFYEHGAGYDGDSELNQGATHWRPLPAPPKEDDR